MLTSWVFRHCNKKEEGFTLVELLVALAVLSVGILGVMNLMISSVGIIGGTNDRVVAANLAQEGIEIAINVRNTNWIENAAYDAGLATGDQCADAATQAIGACGNYTLNWTGSMYTHQAGTPTQFSRIITITPATDAASNNYLQVEAAVTWDEGAQSITAETHIYDWR